MKTLKERHGFELNRANSYEMILSRLSEISDETKASKLITNLVQEMSNDKEYLHELLYAFIRCFDVPIVEALLPQMYSLFPADLWKNRFSCRHWPKVKLATMQLFSTYRIIFCDAFQQLEEVERCYSCRKDVPCSDADVILCHSFPLVRCSSFPPGVGI
jgi:hypothetical protein